jgi:hypothetical protein
MFNQQQPDPRIQRNGFNLPEFVMETWAVSVEVFLHRRIGARYIGMQGLAVILLVPIYFLVWQENDCTPMLWFMLAFLGMCCIARGKTLVQSRQNSPVHSRYSGEPILWRFFPRLSEERVKQCVEPPVVFAAGLLLCAVSEPLGVYLMIAAACMFFIVSANIAWWRQRSIDLHDSVIEQQQIAERFRELRGDQF